MIWTDPLPPFGPPAFRVVERPVRNQSARAPGAAIDAIVLHDTTTRSVQSVLHHFDDSASQASAHFLLDRDGTTYRLVDPARKAWHAGVSILWGVEDLNQRSVGIELVDVDQPAPGSLTVGPGDTYTDAQLTALLALTVDLVLSFPAITLHRIVGHEHIAVPRGRKVDPGPDFPWGPFLEAVGWQLQERRRA